jgi:hypothetical protein
MSRSQNFLSLSLFKMFLLRGGGMALSEQRLRNGLNDKGNLVRFPRETEALLQSNQIGFEAHPASRLMGIGGREASQGLCMLDCLLSRRGGLSTSNSFLLYKLLIRSMVDYTCLVWRFAVCTHANNPLVVHLAVFSLQRAHRANFFCRPSRNKKPRILTKYQFVSCGETFVRQISRHLCAGNRQASRCCPYAGGQRTLPRNVRLV